MKSQKSFKSNLEKNRFIFFQLGLIIALSAILGAFEWKSQARELDLSKGAIVIIDDDIDIKIIKPEDEKPKKKKLEPLKLKIVEDDKKTKEIFIDSEADQKTVVEYEKELKLDDETQVVDDTPTRFPQFMSEFPGGEVEMFKFFQKNIQYPDEDIRNSIDGTVILTFVVEKDGSITNIEILRSISNTIDAEAIRIVKKMPKWTPGQQGIDKVRVQFNLPIKFKLN
ncbi:MAG: energy transducer TonB [Saprospiraceae bacterium]|nr:energy transducer TonB [Saprospiraceae bacterium]